MIHVLTIFKRFFTERFHDQSAQMAYYFMLAIFPFLIFAFSLIRFLPFQVHDMLAMIEPFVPEGSFQLIRLNLIDIIANQRAKIASFSLLAAFWIASMAVQSLVRAMNDAYEIVRKEHFLLALGKDFILTAALMITLTISLLVPVAEEIIRIFIAETIHLPYALYQWWFIIKWIIGSLILFAFFTLLYKLVPSGKTNLRHCWPGALFAMIGWQSASLGFSYYVSFASYSRLYGQLGNMIVLMIWFYLTAAILLIGALINAEKIGKDV